MAHNAQFVGSFKVQTNGGKLSRDVDGSCDALAAAIRAVVEEWVDFHTDGRVVGTAEVTVDYGYLFGNGRAKKRLRRVS